MKCIEFVMNIPSPYRVHLLTEMWRQTVNRGYAFHVSFMTRGYKHLPPSWMNPKMEFPFSYCGWDIGFGIYHLNLGLVFRMIFNPPDILVCGSSYDTFTGALIQVLGRARTKVIWIEGNTKTPGKMSGVLGWFKRLVMSHCQYAAVPGSDGAKFIQLHQSMTRRKMPKSLILPNLVDERRFKLRGEFEASKITEIREMLGASESDKLIITPARLIEVKGLVPYINLLDQELMSGWKQVIIGNGRLKDEIMLIIKKKGLEDVIRIIEHVPYEDMPKYYAAADLMLLPSLYDPNPLSAVEAVHAGLPLAYTWQAGNVDEAVTEGRNGWVLPVLDQVAFKAKLREVFATPIERLREMGRVSNAENAQFWNTKAAIKKFLDGLDIQHNEN